MAPVLLSLLRSVTGATNQVPAGRASACEVASGTPVPELPDVELYLAALRPRVLGHAVRRTRVASPFFVRTFDPPLTAIEGRAIVTLARAGKRLVFGFEDELFVVVHLMIAGRLRWLEPGAKIP